MRLVKLKLREPNPFWILSPILLKKGKEESPYIDIDKLTEEQVSIINRSIRDKQISFISSNTEYKTGTITSINVFESTVSTEDIEEEYDVIPEIVCVTDPVEEEVEKEQEMIISEELFEEAKILLSKNGNTVRKTIKSLPKDSNSLAFLHACLEVESNNGNREGILLFIQETIMEM